jgi:hypothetical protein
MPALAIAAIGAELIYFVVTTLFDLQPLNNLRAATAAEKRQEVAMNLPIMAAPIVLLAISTAVGSRPWVDYGAVAVQAVILVGGCCCDGCPTSPESRCRGQLRART